MELLIVSTLLSILHSGVFSQVTKREYASMPELFHLDDFDRCLMLGKDALYCTFKLQLAPLEGAPSLYIWRVIQKISSKKKNFRHDWLRHGICVPLTCPSIAKNQSNYINDAHLREGISNCYSAKLKELGLKGHVTDMYCETEESLYRVDNYDITIGVFLVLLVMIVMLSSFYEGIARYRSKSDYDRITSTKYGKIIVCFSIPKNWDKLKMDPDSNRIKCMDGMRFYTMVLVVTAHTIMASTCNFSSNPQYTEKITSDPKSIFFSNGHYVTQVFFVMSGWLLSYHFFLTFEKRPFQFTYILYMFVHRFIRLTTSLAVVVAINATWLPHIGRGPLWDIGIGNEYRNCRRNWWTNLLYINNYYDVKNICLQHTWYLAADTQLFLYSLLILGIVWMKKRIASKIFSASLIIGVLIPGILTYINDYDILLRSYPENLQRVLLNVPEWLYIVAPGHTSVGGYTMGLITGYISYQTRGKMIFRETYHHVLWWMISFALPLTVIFLAIPLYDDNYTASPLVASIHVALSRNVYALGMCVMIFGFTENVGWLLKDAVLAPPLQCLGRLTYCVYLVHVPVIRIRSAQIRSPVHLSETEFIYQTCGDLVVSYVFAIILCLFVEMPTSALQKLITSKETKLKVR